MKGKGLSYFYITVAAILWGITGFFTKTLTGLGFTAAEMNFGRNLAAASIIGIIFFLEDRRIFRLKSVKDFLGIAGIAVFGYCAYGTAYVVAINETSVGVAGALFYTYPMFVLVLSRFIFKEKITPKKIAVIIIASVGCLFVSGVLESADTAFSAKGILFGLLSGLTFGIYNVLSKKYLGEYSSKTITFYLFLIAVFVFGVIASPVKTIVKITAAHSWLPIVGFSIAISILPYLTHLKGLEKVEASKASIISTTEPISALVLGIMVYGESPTALKILGIVFIVGSVCFMSSQIGEGWGKIGKAEREEKPFV